MNVKPPLVVVSTGSPVPPALNTGAVKSLVRPTTTPLASLAVTVHDITSLIRVTVVNPLTEPAHESVDTPVGDDTLNENEPVVNEVVELSFSVTRNGVVAAAGAVN